MGSLVVRIEFDVYALMQADKDRFKNPYHHNIAVAGESQTLVLHQAPFSTAGFASTGR